MRTHLVMVADRSGSMGDDAFDVEASAAINSFTEDQKAQPGECTLSFWQFDDQIEHIYRGLIQDFGEYRITPRNMTALRDAIGTAGVSEGEYLAGLPEDERPELVLVQIMTDGKENKSREFSYERVQEMITHQTQVYSWVFTFMGAGLEVAKQALRLGFDPNHTTVFDATGASVRSTYHDHSLAYSGLRSGRTREVVVAAAVSGDGSVDYDEASRVK